MLLSYLPEVLESVCSQTILGALWRPDEAGKPKDSRAVPALQ